MGNSVFWRVFWKEYRQIRAFWLAILGFAVLLEAIMFVAAMFPSGEIPIEAFYAAALHLPVLYGLGCGALMFAAEHEAETFEFQRALPLSAGQLLGGKLCFALASAALLPGVLWVFAWLSAGRTLPNDGWTHLGLWLSGLGLSIELFAWAALFSLLLGRVLWATVLSVGFVCLVAIAAIPGAGSFVTWILHIRHAGHPVALALHVLITAAVLAVDLWLGRRWLREHPLPWSRPSSSTRATPRGSADRRLGQRLTIWGRLIWHAWMQARWTLGIILAVAGGIVAFQLIMDLVSGTNSMTRFTRVPLVMSPLIAAVVGATVYWSDQRKEQFRFFAERGVSPRRVWASRQVVAVTAVVVWFALSFVCLAAELANTPRWYVPGNTQTGTFAHIEIPSEAILGLQALVGLSMLSYAVGQIFSLTIRSGVIALFLGLLASWAAGMWAAAMWEFRVPLWFSVAPIPIVCFCVSWWRAPDWLVERSSWRSRVELALAIILPLTAMGVAVVGYRVYEIPAVARIKEVVRERRPQFSSEGLRTSLLYYDAFSEFLSAEHDPDTVDSSPSRSQSPMELARDSQSGRDPAEGLARGVQTFMDAAGRSTCQFPSPQLRLQTGDAVSEADWQKVEDVDGHAVQLAGFVLATCDTLEQDGQLEAALDRYVAVMAFARHLYDGAGWQRQQRADSVERSVLERLPQWAAHPGQTAETIRTAAERLERECFQFTPSRRDGIVQEYLSYQSLLNGEPPEEAIATAQEAFVVWFLSNFMPWEHARAERLLNYNASSELMRMAVIEQLERSGECIRKVDDAFRDNNVAGWIETTPGFVRPHWMLSEAVMVDAVAMWAARRRIARLQLALAAWRAEHGHLPRRLDQLVDSELDSLPIDPFTGHSFRYQMEGADSDFACRNISTSARETSERSIAAGTPFLWSAGPEVVYSPYTRSGPVTAKLPDEFTHVDYVFCPPSGGTPQPITTDRELWTRGVCFPIPRVAVD